MKVEFLNELIVKPYRKEVGAIWESGRWILVDDFVIRIFDRKKNCQLITIPSGFVTDFASVPRFFWRVLDPLSASEASVPHDFLYRKGIVTKAQSDKIFLLGMVALKVPKWKRQLMYYAVKLFGGSSYNHFTEDKLKIDL